MYRTSLVPKGNHRLTTNLFKTSKQMIMVFMLIEIRAIRAALSVSFNADCILEGYSKEDINAVGLELQRTGYLPT